MEAHAERKHTIINGVDVDRLFETIDLVKEKPEIAKFNFRAKNKWLNGGHNHTTIKDFYGAIEVHPHETPFELDADEPPLLLGEDKGANPVEHALNAVVACVTSSMVDHGAAKGIKIRGIESRVEGDLDLRGSLGISDDVPVGYEKIRIFFKIDADISDKEKEELIRMGEKFSPVFNTLSNATPVVGELDKS